MSINDISIDENNEKEKGREGEGGEVGERARLQTYHIRLAALHHLKW